MLDRDYLVYIVRKQIFKIDFALKLFQIKAGRNISNVGGPYFYWSKLLPFPCHCFTFLKPLRSQIPSLHLGTLEKVIFIIQVSNQLAGTLLGSEAVAFLILSDSLVMANFAFSSLLFTDVCWFFYVNKMLKFILPMSIDISKKFEVIHLVLNASHIYVYKYLIVFNFN